MTLLSSKIQPNILQNKFKITLTIRPDQIRQIVLPVISSSAWREDCVSVRMGTNGLTFSYGWMLAVYRYKIFSSSDVEPPTTKQADSFFQRKFRFTKYIRLKQPVNKCTKR
jgi:hypothetical protein